MQAFILLESLKVSKSFWAVSQNILLDVIDAEMTSRTFNKENFEILLFVAPCRLPFLVCLIDAFLTSVSVSFEKTFSPEILDTSLFSPASKPRHVFLDVFSKAKHSARTFEKAQKIAHCETDVLLPKNLDTPDCGSC